MTLEELEQRKRKLLDELNKIVDDPQKELELAGQIEVYEALIEKKIKTGDPSFFSDDTPDDPDTPDNPDESLPEQVETEIEPDAQSVTEESSQDEAKAEELPDDEEPSETDTDADTDADTETDEDSPAEEHTEETAAVIEEQPEYKIIDPEIGDEVLFGTDIRGEKLRWKVLDIQDQKILVISSYKLCNRPYHNKCEDITWKDCSLREWLNNDFYNDRFSQSERSKIIPCNILNEDNPSFNTPGCSRTTDNVFLLSIDEAKEFFSDDKARDINSRWWLRSPGCKSCFAACVGWGLYGYTGVIDAEGVRVDWFDINGSLGVRPAMWIQTDEQ
jgi:hypothetical protein